LPTHLAGCGQGQDDSPPDDAERARLRGQALGWLRADLSLRTQRKAIVRDINRAQGNSFFTRDALPLWKKDRDLAGLRDPGALEKLPVAERAAWRALWAEVDRLLDEAENTRFPR
jgi:hypothetical protein